MYESNFGLTGSPFNLNPDPGFYFQSKGHGHALSYLRFGVHQGEGFVVVTGDIGAGKTTLVRTLLAELDSSTIVAAQIVSTQLDAGDLLRSVAIAFGISIKDLSKAELIASVEAFLTLLVTQGRRALLVIDEAQNLDMQAIEELRMLSNFQLGNHALLQSFLVGQPELRTLLTSKPMEQFRQRVIASCHLGPMDRAETQAYVEHRLSRVGWAGRPHFEPNSFDRIFEATGGIPRRVNLLCSRLLLATYLADSEVVDEQRVVSVAAEARTEVEAAAFDALSAEAVPADPMPRASAVQRARRAGPPAAGPMLCVVANPTDDLEMALLLRSLQSRNDIAQLLHVRIGEPDTFTPNDSFLAALGVEVPTIELQPDAGASRAAHMADVMCRFGELVELHRPGAVLIAGSGDSALACAIAANKLGCRVAHVDAGLRGPAAHHDDELNRSVIDQLAEVRCVSDHGEYEALQSHGLGESRQLMFVGDLLGESVAEAAALAGTPTEVLMRASIAGAAQFESQGYCVVVLDSGTEGGGRRLLGDLARMLRGLSRDLPIVWPMSAKTVRRLDSLGLRKLIRDPRIAVLPAPDFLQFVALLGRARCVLTDSMDVRRQAEELDVPSLVIESHTDGPVNGSEAGASDLSAMADQLRSMCSQSRTQVLVPADRRRAADGVAEYLARWVAVDGPGRPARTLHLAE